MTDANRIPGVSDRDDVHPGRRAGKGGRGKAGGEVSSPSGLGRNVNQNVAGQAKMSEREIQRLIINYLAALGIDAVHVPNGTHLAGDGKARAMQSNALKKAGVMPGFADLIVIDRRVRRVGFIEVKARKGTISLAQDAFADLATGVWCLPYAVVRSVDDTAAALAEWGWR
ncbi:MAG: hypothetical protein H0W71_09485 [Sphingomonas sp.]|nr:hypothetical protein [Sphingomonas sp.]